MRIVSLVPSVTETLFELGLGDQIVAVTRWCTRPADEVRKKPRIGGTKNPKLDSIREYNPDLVIMDCDENRKEDAEALEHSGIKTLALFPKTVNDSIQVLRTFGELFSVQEQANAWICEIEQRSVEYHSLLRQRTLILIWRSPFMSVNQDTYVHSICDLFGMLNVCADSADRYPKITVEEIKRLNPDVVLFPDEPYPFRAKHIEQFRMDFPDLNAVKQNRLPVFDGTHITWYGYGTLRALHEFPAVLSSLQ